MAFSTNGNFENVGGEWKFFEISMKELEEAALYNVSLKKKKIILKFVKITGEEN